jgi:hypothetical protein
MRIWESGIIDLPPLMYLLHKEIFSLWISPKNCISQKVSFLAFKLLDELPWVQVCEGEGGRTTLKRCPRCSSTDIAYSSPQEQLKKF